MHPDTQEILVSVKQKFKNRKRIVFVSGNFNIVHPGHLRLLRFASECGDFLVVGVNGNNFFGSEPLLDESLRLEGIKAISWVDFAFILNDRPEEFIQNLKPGFVIKGKEHEEFYNPEADVVKSYGGKLLFSSGDISFSLEELLQDESKRIISPWIDRQDAFMKRHDFSTADLVTTMNSFSDIKAVVLGEIIIDEYINCDSLGMSREDPTIVVTPVKSQTYLGGAGIVAAHAKSLGADVSFFSVTGDDKTAEFAVSMLDQYNVRHFLYKDESRPTILKQRFRSSGKSLLRVNHLRQHPISKELQNQLKEELFSIIDKIDLLIFSDFNYGCLPNPLVKAIIAKCRKKDIMMVADSQSSSQIGDISRFTHMKLSTPTEREARLAVRDFESGLVVLAEKLRQKARTNNIFITLDKEGMLIHAEGAKEQPWQTDKIGAMNSSPKDPAGAGDSLLTCAALAMASGADLWTSAYLGSLAAACQIDRVGNIPLIIQDMMVKLSK